MRMSTLFVAAVTPRLYYEGRLLLALRVVKSFCVTPILASEMAQAMWGKSVPFCASIRCCRNLRRLLGHRNLRWRLDLIKRSSWNGSNSVLGVPNRFC